MCFGILFSACFCHPLWLQIIESWLHIKGTKLRQFRWQMRSIIWLNSPSCIIPRSVTNMLSYLFASGFHMALFLGLGCSGRGGVSSRLRFWAPELNWPRLCWLSCLLGWKCMGDPVMDTAVMWNERGVWSPKTWIRKVPLPLNSCWPWALHNFLKLYIM